jgi:hypothetical protein
MRSRSSPATLALLVGVLLVTGCGGGPGFKKSGPPPPSECLKRYNENPAATALGAHAYGGGHNSRAAHVFRITDEQNGLEKSCAVIFAAADSDREYGLLGAIDYPVGWDYTTQLQVTPEKRAEIQRLGAEQANVALEPDGSLAAFK